VTFICFVKILVRLMSNLCYYNFRVTHVFKKSNNYFNGVAKLNVKYKVKFIPRMDSTSSLSICV